MTKMKLYDNERDVIEMDRAGGYYCRHVSAMTGEALHSKSDIAAELGWRDMQIDQLKADNGAYKKLHDWLKAENEVLTLRVMAGERQELDALKSATVVMPDRRIQALAGVSLFDLGHAKGWNDCLDKFESLNRSKTNEQ